MYVSEPLFYCWSLLSVHLWYGHIWRHSVSLCSNVYRFRHTSQIQEAEIVLQWRSIQGIPSAVQNTLDSDKYDKTIPLDSGKAAGHRCTEASDCRLFNCRPWVCYNAWVWGSGFSYSTCGELPALFSAIFLLCSRTTSIYLEFINRNGAWRVDLWKDMVSRIRFTVETDTLHLSAMDEAEAVSSKVAAIKAGCLLKISWQKSIIFVETFSAGTSISSFLQNKITML